MKKAIVFGIGIHYKRYTPKLRDEYNIVALCDNDPEKWNTVIDGHTVLEPAAVKWDGYEVVVVSTGQRIAGIILQQLRGYNVSFDKIDWRSSGLRVPLCSVWTENSNGVRVNITSLCDYLVCREVFTAREYELEIPPEDMVCIDMGMNIGCASLYFASLSCVQKVYSYELMESTYQKALANIALNPGLAQKITAHNVGLSNRNEEISVSDNIIPGNVSLFKNAGGIMKRAFIKDAAEAVSPVYAEHSGKSKIILKVDTEGAEYDIFESMDNAGLLRKTDVIIGEWHNILDTTQDDWDEKVSAEPLLDKLRNVFSKNNFRFKLTTTRDGLGYFYAFKQ